MKMCALGLSLVNVTSKEGFMSDSFFCHTVSLLGILILTSVALGCTTVVAPVSHPEAMIPDQNHGLLVGAVYLDRNEANLSSGLTWPRYIKWLIEEETNGSRILLSRLPLDGPFAVKLPPGSYRITDVSLHSDQGVWYTGLPTTFRVQSGGCTNLGVWNLELKKEFRVGWLIQEVSNQQ